MHLKFEDDTIIVTFLVESSLELQMLDVEIVDGFLVHVTPTIQKYTYTCTNMCVYTIVHT